MALVKVIWKPTDRQLCQFGMAALAALPLLGWMWGASSGTLALLTTIGAAFAGVGWFWPQALKPVFLTATLVTLPIGFVVGEVAIAVTFFVVLLPMGLVFRLLGRADPMNRRFAPEAKTYWAPKAQPAGAGSYFRQY